MKASKLCFSLSFASGTVYLSNLSIYTCPLRLKKKITDWFFRERENGRENHRLVVLPIHAFIGWIRHVHEPEIEPATLVHQNNIPTNWATQSGLPSDFKNQTMPGYSPSPNELYYLCNIVWLTFMIFQILTQILFLLRYPSPSNPPLSHPRRSPVPALTLILLPSALSTHWDKARIWSIHVILNLFSKYLWTATVLGTESGPVPDKWIEVKHKQ